jgi:TRAP-type C4-dicarboxylate transport system permease small subunit
MEVATETPQSDQEKILYPPPGRLGRIVRRSEEIIFAIIVIALIILGLIPMGLRLAGMGGMLWITPLTRYFVVVIALLGAGTAVRERSSISVDIISHLLSDCKRIFLRVVTEIISAIVCAIFIWVSIRFVIEFEHDTIAFLHIPEWWLAMILPCGFFLLTLRLLIAAGEDFMIGLKLAKSGRSQGPKSPCSQKKVSSPNEIKNKQTTEYPSPSQEDR